MEKAKTKSRCSNIELLRILSILLIISFHYVYKSGFEYEILNYNTLIVKVFYFFGELGVNLFGLITGYFMINGKFKPKKLILLLLEILFYYLLTILIGMRIGVISKPIMIRDKFLLFFPTLLSKYWFTTVYIIIYVLTPYLNIFIKAMSKEQFKKFLTIVLILWCIIPTFFGVFYNSSETLLYYSRFIWLTIIYFVGAYIKLFDFDILNNNIKKFLCMIISFLLMILSIFVIFKFRVRLGHLGLNEISYFWTPNNILMFLLSISIFGLFLNIKMKNIKIINIISSTTLGIYLMHDGILCNYIWQNIFRTKQYLLGSFPIEHILLTTMIIFLIGIIVDLLRQIVEKQLVSKFLDFVFKKITKSK